MINFPLHYNNNKFQIIIIPSCYGRTSHFSQESYGLVRGTLHSHFSRPFSTVRCFPLKRAGRDCRFPAIIGDSSAEIEGYKRIVNILRNPSVTLLLALFS